MAIKALVSSCPYNKGLELNVKCDFRLKTRRFGEEMLNLGNNYSTEIPMDATIS